MSIYEHSEWLALLGAIIASPDDDLPRLIAADWLDERDDPLRAEFIRLQIELARGEGPEDRLDWMRNRERELWQHPTGGPLWALDACPNIVQMNVHSTTKLGVSLAEVHRVRFRRGFPYALSCPAQDWLLYGAGIVPRQPLECLKLTQCDELPVDRWWPMFDTLRLLRSVTLDSRWSRLPRMLREQLPDVDVLPVR